MRGSGGFEKLVNVMMNLLLSVGIAIIAMGIASVKLQVMVLTPLAVFNTVLCCFVTGYTISSLVPIMGWGRKLAELSHAGEAASYGIVCLTLGFCMGLFIGLVSGYISNISLGFDAVLEFYAGNLAIIIVSAIVLVLVLLRPVMRLGAAVSGFDPGKAPCADCPS